MYLGCCLPGFLFSKAANQLGSVQPVMMQRVGSSQVQDFAFGLFELHEFYVYPFLQSVQVPLNGCLVLQCIICSSSLVSSMALVKIQSRRVHRQTPEEIHLQLNFQQRPLTTTLMTQAVFHQSNYASTQKMRFHLGYHGQWCQNGFAKAKINGMHSRLLIHTSSHFIVEGKQVCKT